MGDNSDVSNGEGGGEVTELRGAPSEPSKWPLVRERTIPTERPPLVDEI
jgi:hypothetical protein